MGDPLVLELPDMCAQGGSLLLPVVEVAIVAGDPLLGGVDGKVQSKMAMFQISVGKRAK